MNTIASTSTSTDKAELIQKEAISQLTFPHSEILTSTENILRRRMDLDRAVTLGNRSKSKVRIFFEDEGGLKIVETTIWAVTEKMTVLKSSTLIPINRISKVNFY